MDVIMVHATQNHCVSGRCAYFRMINQVNTMFPKLDLFPSSGVGKETHHPFVPLQNANLNYRKDMISIYRISNRGQSLETR
jgi:hypothetical protein